MLGLKVTLKDAEKWKQYIVINNIIDKDHFYIKDKKHIYFPITTEFAILKSNDDEISFVQKDFPLTDRKGTLKENLSKTLTKEEFSFVKTAHDIIGNIAIVEIPVDLENRAALIAETLLQVNPQIKTVLKKANIHEGVFRTQKMTYLAGVNTKETMYKENDIRLKLDVEQVYFSIRLGNERKRIMKQVKHGEEILVMFSGCGVYPIVISRNSEAKHIDGVEINPVGHKYALENIKLNKVKNVNCYCGDVREIVPTLNKKYDRIAMPLPKTAEEFLDVAFKVSKEGTIIHLYQFIDKRDIGKKEKEIEEICHKNNIDCKMLGSVTCGQHAPLIYRMCIDFQITKI